MQQQTNFMQQQIISACQQESVLIKTICMQHPRDACDESYMYENVENCLRILTFVDMIFFLLFLR